MAMDKMGKGKMITIAGIAAMILLVLTKVSSAAGLAQYSLFVGLALFFVVEAVEKTPDPQSGLRFSTFFADFKKPGVLLFVLLPVATAIGSILLGNLMLGDRYVNHVLGRTGSILSFDHLPLFIVQLILGALGEEIAFRGFFVGKGMRLLPYGLCAVVSSAVFAAAHIAAGDIGVVVYDVAAIFIDALIYAEIYRRTDNCLISAVSHLLCNASAFAFVFLF
ncbi:MAG: CPBP family intramembrane metalloprotease [Clostridia bacterium]|nr:CPBP family intramembrane metalloprotease [Clostridia bacterium]